MNRARLALCVALGALALGPGCHRPRTQLVLRVDTDMSQGRGQTLTGIRVVVYAADDPARVVLDRPLDLGVGAAPVYLPSDVLGITPRSDASRAVRVEVTALQEGTELFTHRSVTPFVPDQTALLYVFLADHCRYGYQHCGAGFTCGATGCEPEMRTTPPGVDGGFGDAASAPDVTTRCAANERACGGECVDPASDARHCGGCGMACPAGALCTSGVCGAAGAALVDVDLGFAHSCARRADGELRCWGSNTMGQLGLGTHDDPVLAPARVTVLTAVSVLTAGGDHTCAVDPMARGWCWGRTDHFQLGTSNVTPQIEPVLVPALPPVTAMEAGQYHTCAVLAERGAVWCWGRNDQGQLGRGVVTDPMVRSGEAPALVLGLEQVSALAAGQDHTCAIRGAGEVHCWGLNSLGQLGLATGSAPPYTFPSPQRVPSGDDAIAIAAGLAHTCVVRRAGAVLCWGDNTRGQLGRDVSMAQSRVPLDVPGISDALAVVAGETHTCVLRASGAVVCFGDNAAGQLGDGPAGGVRAEPRAVPGVPHALRIAAGDSYTCALSTDGRVRCWGEGTDGQLGNGARASSPSPVLVMGVP